MSRSHSCSPDRSSCCLLRLPRPLRQQFRANRHRHGHRRAGRRRARRDRHGPQHRHQRLDRGAHQRRARTRSSSSRPGRYRITAGARRASRRSSREGITLRTAETVTVNVTLSIGRGRRDRHRQRPDDATSNRTRSTISQTIENKRISELPLNGRQVYMLLQLTAGTLFTQTTFGATGFSGTRAWDVNGSLSIHGSRTGNNEFLMEGAPSAGTGGGTGNWNYAPPVDAIEEFKVSDVERRRVVRPHQRRRRQHDAPLGHEPAARLRHPAPPRHLARREPDPEHPQQHLERGAQVLTTARRW